MTGIKIIGGEHIKFTSQDTATAEFELEPGVVFPSFPTADDEEPVLEIVEDLGGHATGHVYKAILLVHPDPDDCDDESNAPPSYAIKVVDADWRCEHEYRNYIMDLYNEYTIYCLLEVGMQYPFLGDVIKRVTATCYGLYRLSDRAARSSSPIFALITEYLDGNVNQREPTGAEAEAEDGNYVECVDHTSRCAGGCRDMEGMCGRALLKSLICLHAVGLQHNDPARRNVIFDEETGMYKFIDFCASEWHDCPGILTCKELVMTWRDFGLFEKDALLDFEEEVKDSNNLTLLDARSFLERTKDDDVKTLATGVKDLAARLDPEM